VAVIVIGFCTVDGAVYVMLHVPVDNVHVGEPNTPPTFPSLQVIVPVGMFCEFDVSATAAVIVTCPPADMVDWGDVITTDVGSWLLCDTCNVPELV